jgi:hypothetical protein
METDKQKLLSELKNNPRVTAYLAGFEESSAERFLESYAGTKQMLLQHGEDWRRWQLNDSDYFRTSAEKFYWLIAEKKLFNLQCLWRAEQINLPVAVTWEFQYWSKNIKACPFLEDATEAEIEAMIGYLERASYDHEEYDPWDWQAHDEFREEETGIGAGSNYPAWYEAYDNYFGTQHLMALPDIKGEREEKYLAAWRASWHEESRAKSTVKVPAKPSIYSDEKSIEEFIRKTEGYKILDYYRLYRARFDNSEFKERLHNELDLFMEEPDAVWIPEGKFPDAIFQAGHLLRVSHIKSLLPELHQNHLERKAMGIGYELEGPVEDDDLVRATIERIKEGKRLLGEEEA